MLDNAGSTAGISWKRNFYTLWVAQIIAIIGFQSVQPFLPYYIQELNIDNLADASIWAGYLGTVHGFSMALSAPIWGAIADRFGRKPMVVRAMVGGGVTVILTAFVGTVEQLLVVRFLHGVLSGSVTASITMVSTTTPKAHLGYALGMMSTAFMFGGAIGALIGGPAIDYFGYYNCFIASGLLVVLAGIMVQSQVREHFQRTAKAARKSFLNDARRVLQIGNFRVVLVCISLMQFSFAVVMPVFPLFLQELAQTTNIASLAGPIFASSMLVGGLSSAAVGRWSSRIGVQRGLVGGLAITAFFFFAEGLAPTLKIFVTLMILGGISGGALRPLTNLLVSQIIPEEDRGKAFGVLTSASALGWGGGPAIGGYMGAHLGYRSVFFFTSALFVLVALWVWRAMRQMHSEPSDSEPIFSPN